MTKATAAPRAPRLLTATYRLQLHAGFGFRAAAAMTDYLDALGVSHAYASPYLAAAPNSTHGYDLVDPKRLNPEVGSEDEYRAWTDGLSARRMGHIVDVVPNHMAASIHNGWWRDVLENGPSSLYADHFDIEWCPPKEALHNKVLLPILGAQYGEVLEKGELRLERAEGAFFVRYWERQLPVNPSSVAGLLGRAAAAVEASADDPRKQELESIVTGLGHLPSPTETEPARRAERAREKEVLKRRLAQLVADPEIAQAIDAEVTRVNGTAGEPKSFDDLDALLLDQCYRLAFWRVATEEINYRRFFDINDLAAIRMEDDAVFDDANELLWKLVADGRVGGVRLDHTDGLYDPASFFRRFRRGLDDASREKERPGEPPPYLVIEKILTHGEALPTSWDVDGTTGYDFLASVGGLFVDPAAEAAMTDLHATVTGDDRTFAAHALDAKRAAMRSSLSSEIHMLSQKLERIAMRDRRSRDFTLPMLHRAVSETIAAFPVYRTYIRPDGSREPEDSATIVRASRLARKRNPEVSPSVFDYLRDVLLLEHMPEEPSEREARVAFALRFQQLTGPVMAKSVEDTAFYTFVRFVGLNEVGAEPSEFGTRIDAFHRMNATRRETWPLAMSATTTHDTKRSEDVRARLAVLAEIPDLWRQTVRGWFATTEQHGSRVEEEPVPSATDKLLLFQTMLGAWPLGGLTRDEDVAGFGERMVTYAVKAAREAKQHTSWLSPDEAYEDALGRFVKGCLDDARFRDEMNALSARITVHGASNGLGMALLKVASPGVPDTYQGSELWDQRLVDPDNRGLVDFDERRRALAQVDEVDAPRLLRAFHDGRVKLRVLARSLRARRDLPELFREGDYRPVDAGEEIVAFRRHRGEASALCAVTRFPWRVTGGEARFATGDAWGDRAIAFPAGRYRNVLTDEEVVIGAAGIEASKLFAQLPVALLVRA